jgi:DNA polymerase I-like protein with 3'-5' exonuclease and polymerase domains
MALAYVDFEQQEFGIAAALSGDAAMAEAYRSGDPYLAFGKQAGAIPADGTKATHAAERALFKACTLAVQYGMGAEGLAQKIGRPAAAARELLGLHRATYPAFWRWSQAAVDRAILLGKLETVFGWPIHVGPSADPTRPGANPRSLANFPCQANGAEMLRLAACLVVDRGIGLCAPVHDAVLVEGPAAEIEDVVAQTRAAMAEASRIVLAGFEIGTDAKIVRWPDRYVDESGAAFWDTVLRLAGPVPEFGNRADLVRGSCGTTSGKSPNRATLIEESSRESLLSLGREGTDGGP